MATCDVLTLLNRASNIASVGMRGEWKIARLNLWYQILQAQNPAFGPLTWATIQSLLTSAQANCFDCLTPGEMKVVKLQLLCEIATNAPNPFPIPVDALRFWYKADAGVFKDAGITPAANGDMVQQWNDSSGNGFHLKQPTLANRPTFLTGALGGQPVVFFSGTGMAMTSIPNFPQPITMYMLLDISGAGPTMVNRIWVNTAISLVFGYDLAAFYAEDNPGLISYATNPNGLWLFTILFNAGATSILRVNQVQQATGVLGNDALDTFTLQNNAIITPMLLEVGEIIGYQTAHNATTMQQIEQYLTNKWG